MWVIWLIEMKLRRWPLAIDVITRAGMRRCRGVARHASGGRTVAAVEEFLDGQDLLSIACPFQLRQAELHLVGQRFKLGAPQK